MASTPIPTATKITTIAGPQMFRDGSRLWRQKVPFDLLAPEIPEPSVWFLDFLLMALGRQNVGESKTQTDEP